MLFKLYKQLPIIFFQWVVGLFEEENKFSVIPSNWIVQLGNTTFCQWPKKRITDTMIINSENPAKDWQPFPVKIIEQYCKLYTYQLNYFFNKITIVINRYTY